jgi:hypothetical protein
MSGGRLRHRRCWMRKEAVSTARRLQTAAGHAAGWTGSGTSVSVGTAPVGRGGLVTAR